MTRLHDFLFAEDWEGAVQKEFRQILPILTENWKILIVDDETDVHDVTRISLKRLVFENRGVEFISAYSATQAKELLLAHPEVAVILLDVVMEDEDAGLALVQYVRETLKNTMVRIILRTGHPGHAPGESITMEYEINDYWEKTELTKQRLVTAVITALRSFRDLVTINELNREIEDTQKDLLFSLGEIAEARSFETGNHVRRVGEVAKILALKCGIKGEEAEMLRLAASMHDLGKLAIENSILNKPGSLTPDEFEIIKTHSQLGYEMLKTSQRPLLRTAALIAREHHENFDGTGYPNNLKGEEIHPFSRIIALADVFDALGNKRAYKDAWSLEEILDYIRKQRGKKFDPQLVDLFINHFDEIAKVREMFPDNARMITA